MANISDNEISFPIPFHIGLNLTKGFPVHHAVLVAWAAVLRYYVGQNSVKFGYSSVTDIKDLRRAEGHMSLNLQFHTVIDKDMICSDLLAAISSNPLKYLSKPDTEAYNTEVVHCNGGEANFEGVKPAKTEVGISNVSTLLTCVNNN